MTISFEQLTPDQQALVTGAYDTDRSSEGLSKLECAGCAVYLGETPIGKHTHFWHYGASDGFVVLPVGGDAQLDYDSGNLFFGDREFTTEGKEILREAQVMLNIIWEVRLLAQKHLPRGESWEICWECYYFGKVNGEFHGRNRIPGTHPIWTELFGILAQYGVDAVAVFDEIEHVNKKFGGGCSGYAVQNILGFIAHHLPR